MMIETERLRNKDLKIGLCLWTSIVFFLSTTECQNIALHKPALHAGTYQNNEGSYGARLAVDGRTDTYSLADTLNDNTPAWWSVDLQATSVIRGVTIIAPLPASEYKSLESFIVTVDTVENNITSQRHTCFFFNNKTGIGPGVEIRRQCDSERVGNYVTVTRNGGVQPRGLGIAEVQVDGALLVDNRAWYKQTRQIGTYNGYISDYAVDNRDDNTCAIAGGPAGSLAWWQVDLESTYKITSVIVSATTTESANQYFQDVAITVDRSNITNSQRICATYNNGSAINPGVKLTLTCTSPLDGRYVTIRRQGGGHQPRSLGLCDVKIIGEYIAGTAPPVTIKSSTETTRTLTTILIPTPASTTTTVKTTTVIPETSTASLLLTPTITPNLPKTDSGLSGGAIAGIVIGSICLGAVAAALIYHVFYRRRLRREFESSIPTAKIESELKSGLETPALDLKHSATSKEESSSHPVLPTRTNTFKSSSAQIIPKSEFSQYVRKQLSNEGGFRSEFKELSSGALDKITTGKLKNNVAKNRFQDILPYDKTLVAVIGENISESGDTYINASFIKGYPNIERKYIATQSPQSNTVNDFWRMIWQQNVYIVVMFTHNAENVEAKCFVYWPDCVGEWKEFGGYRIKTDVQNEFSHYTYRELVVENTSKSREEFRRIKQTQYHSWADRRVPDLCRPLLNFHNRIESLDQGQHPIVVHCSSGVGQTGTFICIDYLLKQLRAEGKLSVFNCVNNLRQQRMNMIQTADQYDFVYEALLETIEIGDKDEEAFQVDNAPSVYETLRLDCYKDKQDTGEYMQLQETAEAPVSNFRKARV